MVQKEVMQQMIKFNRTLFDGAFEATAQLQDQVEKIGNTMMDHAGWLPGESRQIYDSCLKAYKSGCSNFKSFVDD
ncbi:MAG: hypothetical protein PVH26_05975, partial [Desulfosarcina sp.]